MSVKFLCPDSRGQSCSMFMKIFYLFSPLVKGSSLWHPRHLLWDASGGSISSAAAGQGDANREEAARLGNQKNTKILLYYSEEDIRIQIYISFNILSLKSNLNPVLFFSLFVMSGCLCMCQAFVINNFVMWLCQTCRTKIRAPRREWFCLLPHRGHWTEKSGRDRNSNYHDK